MMTTPTKNFMMQLQLVGQISNIKVNVPALLC